MGNLYHNGMFVGKLCYGDNSVSIKKPKEKVTFEWIPVKQGLPKNDDWQIVTIKDESGDHPYIYTDFGWYLSVADCWVVDAEQRTDIIAWCPLPFPYKETKK